MIVLDTNVISEIARPASNAKVLAWAAAQSEDHLYLCDVVLMEQSYGAERIWLRDKSPRYREVLDRLLVVYGGRILAFDRHTAVETGRLRARREAIGRPVSLQDAMIAAICLSHGATLATRNIKDFEGLDLKLVNPFEDG
ncbi:type II toxin-antitoxin system VapC family toxin [Rhizobium sp. BG4]|uniref:type II toxin-antitoxin system VapC family toxin n=1 Tax=Rhizobium sp. BG4 TaxID=2613770 RepID=UPI00193D4B62|nr:type II toxin-antitoxin system VapC family toxin [Rhizobium sp. BG4]QRM43269.1 type II toxin-antitoxin system VapC family toxin [Rhizobium sp. BG4]